MSPKITFSMRLPNYGHLVSGVAILLALIASACTATAPLAPTSSAPVAAPATVTSIPTAGPVNTADLVAFPTGTPARITEAPATLTLSASPSPSGTRLSAAAPVVQVVAPVTNTQISLNQLVYVVAFASSENTVARIEVADDNAKVRTENAPPGLTTFSAVIPWTPSQLGAHVLRVVAFDAFNVPSAPEEIVVSVTPDTRRPTANILYPLGTPQVELGSILQIYAVATDEVGVAQLDLWVDNQIYTYITSPNPGGSSSLPIVFAWTALVPGNHTLLVRAHDVQDQTTDSGPLKVFVADTHSPALSVNFERTNLPVGETLTVTVTAVDVSGVQRVELWTGREITSTVTSTSPARQTSLSTQFAWTASSPGDYSLSVRAYNANGNSKQSPAQIISVLRPGQATPTRAPIPTATRTRTPRPQPTARLQPPAPPVAEISQPQDRFANQWPVRVSFGGRGSGELQRIELWGYYQGQLNPQIICTVDAHATTQKTGQCDWSPTDAGIIYLFAQAIDVYDQFGRSPTISGYVGVPAVPTPAPTPVSLAGRWTAASPAGQFTAVLRPIVTASGTALRGEFKITTIGTPGAAAPVPTGTTSATTVTPTTSIPIPTVEVNGRITSGTVTVDRVTFRVEFTPIVPATATPVAETPTPTPAPTVTPSAPAMDFDCTVDPNGTLLDCRYRDARGQSGTATFRREAGP